MKDKTRGERREKREDERQDKRREKRQDEEGREDERERRDSMKKKREDERENEEREMKRGEKTFFPKNVSGQSNTPAELAQNVSKKFLSDELFLHFSSKVLDLTVFF